MNVMFRRKTKLRGGPEQIDLVGDESIQTGGCVEAEGIREDGNKEMTDIQPNAQVDGERYDFHDENMQDEQGKMESGGENNASPSDMESDGEGQSSDEEVADDDDREGSDEDEADYDGEEGSDEDG
ncbi:unnamed protein product [Cuscuta campestris]|uniref:Uncharacterized protein n=1 Tax=Cuscuta campestris TaxID=132261 RepID=A0A484KSF0_9ASTE|nr:unnamed protein product [Cuscuta campestris]